MNFGQAIVFAALAVAIGLVAVFVLCRKKDRPVAKPEPSADPAAPQGASEMSAQISPGLKAISRESLNERVKTDTQNSINAATQPSDEVSTSFVPESSSPNNPTEKPVTVEPMVVPTVALEPRVNQAEQTEVADEVVDFERIVEKFASEDRNGSRAQPHETEPSIDIPPPVAPVAEPAESPQTKQANIAPAQNLMSVPAQSSDEASKPFIPASPPPDTSNGAPVTVEPIILPTVVQEPPAHETENNKVTDEEVNFERVVEKAATEDRNGSAGQTGETTPSIEVSPSVAPVIEPTEPSQSTDASESAVAPAFNSEHESVEKPVCATTPPVEVMPSPSAQGNPPDVTAVPEVEEEPAEENLRKRVQRYRPPTITTPRAPKSKNPTQSSPPVSAAEVLLDILVRVTFDRFGFCSIGLLPERKADMDEEIIVRFHGDPLAFAAQEDWYQDLQFPEIGSLLQNPIELKGKLACGKMVRWLLTARPIFVLASHPKASGFVQTTRLALGRTHVVLFLGALLSQVEEILKQAGCNAYERVEPSQGIPAGWVMFKNVLPTKALELDAGTDQYFPIKPAPEMEIDFIGGVSLQSNIWLAGYAPKLKLIGQADIPIKVLIDTKEAETTSDGFLTADGHDLPGQHTIHCEGHSFSRTYAIGEPSEDWSAWAAHKLGQSEICGPLVVKSAVGARQPITVPMSTPLLLGAEPGQIYRCSHRNVPHWKGYVPFEVVWALPAHPLHSNKKTARILQFGKAPLRVKDNRKDKATLDWCKAILDASRKGLKVDHAEGEATDWHQYKKLARKIWRATK